MAWGKKQKAALADLFEKKLADPKATKADEIDPVYDMSTEFQACSQDRFRPNYRNFAAEWMMAKGLQGVRRSEWGPLLLSFSLCVVTIFMNHQLNSFCILYYRGHWH